MIGQFRRDMILRTYIYISPSLCDVTSFGPPVTWSAHARTWRATRLRHARASGEGSECT